MPVRIILDLHKLSLKLLAHVATMIVHRHMPCRDDLATDYVLRQVRLNHGQAPGALLPGERVFAAGMAQAWKQFQTAGSCCGWVLLTLDAIRFIQVGLQVNHAVATARLAPPFARSLRTFDLGILLGPAGIVPVDTDPQANQPQGKRSREVVPVAPRDAVVD